MTSLLGGALPLFDPPSRERRATGEPCRRPARRVHPAITVYALGRDGRRLLPPAPRASCARTGGAPPRGSPPPDLDRGCGRRTRRAHSRVSPRRTTCTMPRNCLTANDVTPGIRDQGRRARSGAHGPSCRGIRRSAPRGVPAPVDRRGRRVPRRQPATARDDVAPRSAITARLVTNGVGVRLLRERRYPAWPRAGPQALGGRRTGRARRDRAASRSERTRSGPCAAILRVRASVPGARLWILGGATIPRPQGLPGRWPTRSSRRSLRSVRAAVTTLGVVGDEDVPAIFRLARVLAVSGPARRVRPRGARGAGRGSAGRRVPRPSTADQVPRTHRAPSSWIRRRSRTSRIEIVAACPRRAARTDGAARRRFPRRKPDGVAPEHPRGRASLRCTSRHLTGPLRGTRDRTEKGRWGRSGHAWGAVHVRWPDGKEQHGTTRLARRASIPRGRSEPTRSRASSRHGARPS